MISARQGIHLGGNIASQRVFSYGNIPYSEQNKTTKPGLGIATASDGDSASCEVVIPYARPAAYTRMGDLTSAK